MHKQRKCSYQKNDTLTHKAPDHRGSMAFMTIKNGCNQKILAWSLMYITLSISENSIRSSSVQLRPMGEMLSIPFLNSMNVPLQEEKDERLNDIHSFGFIST